MLGIGQRLTAPLLPRHRAHGARTRRFDENNSYRAAPAGNLIPAKYRTGRSSASAGVLETPPGTYAQTCRQPMLRARSHPVCAVPDNPLAPDLPRPTSGSCSSPRSFELSFLPVAGYVLICESTDGVLLLLTDRRLMCVMRVLFNQNHIILVFHFLRLHELMVVFRWHRVKTRLSVRCNCAGIAGGR